jgi:hypothetical protein
MWGVLGDVLARPPINGISVVLSMLSPQSSQETNKKKATQAEEVRQAGNEGEWHLVV